MMSKDAEREKRLAEALRANLRRRKDQQRAAGQAGAPTGGDAPADDQSDRA